MYFTHFLSGFLIFTLYIYIFSSTQSSNFIFLYNAISNIDFHTAEWRSLQPICSCKLW